MLLKMGSKHVHKGFKRKQVELMQLPKAFRDAKGVVKMIPSGSHSSVCQKSQEAGN